ncbi:hypothetical protein CVT26_009611 [Gymnopilus dilepis]|uniref:Uncharacterized protein n=1 Tax=Gymnopilus dilepis TaxID=231916 RepID=A0A409YIH7_9AGAR|nr:hypothetical protein CVT26_009611 [Gymnopilus dilepis]
MAGRRKPVVDDGPPQALLPAAELRSEPVSEGESEVVSPLDADDSMFEPSGVDRIRSSVPALVTRRAAGSVQPNASTASVPSRVTRSRASGYTATEGGVDCDPSS